MRHAMSLPIHCAHSTEIYSIDCTGVQQDNQHAQQKSSRFNHCVRIAEEHRSMVRKQLHALLDAGFNPLSFFDKDYRKYFYLAECLSLVDLSLTVKLGVQYSLWGGSVINLGTEVHKRK
jgi:hypothetical protein